MMKNAADGRTEVPTPHLFLPSSPRVGKMDILQVGCPYQGFEVPKGCDNFGAAHFRA
jgi:hypothetical protein